MIWMGTSRSRTSRSQRGRRPWWTRGSRLPLLLPVLAVALVAAEAWSAREDALPRSPERVLERALANLNAERYERIRFTNYVGEEKGLERELELWVKQEGRRYKVYANFTAPQRVRGTGVLIIPPSDPAPQARVEPNQYFLYLPALRSVRRVSGAQRADPFFGTELSQGDVEPHPASDFRVLAMEEDRLDGEAVLLLTIEPRFEAGYDRAVFTVAARDGATLRIEQYREDRDEPRRRIVIEREWLESADGHVLPRRLVAHGPAARRTEVEFVERQLDSGIPDRLFSVSTLTRGR